MSNPTSLYDMEDVVREIVQGILSGVIVDLERTYVPGVETSRSTLFGLRPRVTDTKKLTDFLVGHIIDSAPVQAKLIPLKELTEKNRALRGREARVEQALESLEDRRATWKQEKEEILAKIKSERAISSEAEELREIQLSKKLFKDYQEMKRAFAVSETAAKHLKDRCEMLEEMLERVQDINEAAFKDLADIKLADASNAKIHVGIDQSQDASA